jgi:hypothetical protein
MCEARSDAQSYRGSGGADKWMGGRDAVPGRIESPSLAEVEEAIGLVRELYSVVVSRLPNEVKP